MKPIYKPSGRALEYSPDALACNIYTGCPHRCYYCFSPTVLRKDRETFYTNVAPREGIVQAIKRQFEYGFVNVDNKQKDGSYLPYSILLKGKLIHLCFTCDPYPVGYDTSVTREVIKAIKEAGCHVQILTKGGMLAERDFDLLDGNDWFGVTLSGAGSDHWNMRDEPNAARHPERYETLKTAKNSGINTWVSMEPVINPQEIYELIKGTKNIDLFRIGKLNYHPSEIDWRAFGRECERLCIEHDREYYIKADLRAEMAKGV